MHHAKPQINPRTLRKGRVLTDRCLLHPSPDQIGAALIAKDGTLIGRGHNQRVQLGSAIHHGETSALYNSGRLPARAYEGSTMYTTLSPCDMCKSGPVLSYLVWSVEAPTCPFFLVFFSSFFFSALPGPQHRLTSIGPPSGNEKIGTGACLLYGISRVVIGENKNYLGGEAYLRSRGVEVVVLEDAECKALMDKFIAEKPDLWCVEPPATPPPFSPLSFPLECLTWYGGAHGRFWSLTRGHRNEDIGVEERVYSKEGKTAP